MLHPDFSELEDEFSEVIDFLNEGRPEVPTERPSEMVWSAIADALTVSEGHASSADAGYDAPTDIFAGNGDRFGQEQADYNDADLDHADHPDNGVVANGVFSTGAGDTEDTNVRPFQRPQSSADSGRSSVGKRFAVITAVAAAILLVAVPLSLSLRGESLDQRAELLALGESNGLGTAELTDRTLAIDLEGLQPLDGANYELWLLDLEGEELEDLVWIGVVNEDGTFTVPEGVDLDEFSVVDVSIEPEDGDESHSGNSVLRGPLSEA